MITSFVDWLMRLPARLPVTVTDLTPSAMAVPINRIETVEPVTPWPSRNEALKAGSTTPTHGGVTRNKAQQKAQRRARKLQRKLARQ